MLDRIDAFHILEEETITLRQEIEKLSQQIKTNLKLSQSFEIVNQMLRSERHPSIKFGLRFEPVESSSVA